jgi:hypothetical protein
MIGGGAILQVVILSFRLVDEDSGDGSENVGPDPKPHDEGGKERKEEMRENQAGFDLKEREKNGEGLYREWVRVMMWSDVIGFELLL